MGEWVILLHSFRSMSPWESLSTLNFTICWGISFYSTLSDLCPRFKCSSFDETSICWVSIRSCVKTLMKPAKYHPVSPSAIQFKNSCIDNPLGTHTHIIYIYIYMYISIHIPKTWMKVISGRFSFLKHHFEVCCGYFEQLLWAVASVLQKQALSN